MGNAKAVYAKELASFIRDNFGDYFEVHVAVYPEIYRWLTYKMESFGGDTESLKVFGLDVVTKLCETLIQGGAPRIHFYTMNQLGPTKTILDALK